MANLEEDMRLGDLSSDMPEHTGRLEGAMPYTLILFALAAFGALVLFVVYASMAGSNLDALVDLNEKQLGTDENGNDYTLSTDEGNIIKDNYRQDIGYKAAVLGFLVIISYACVYGALKIAHHRR